MSSHTVIWSAASCRNRNTGVYLGLAPQHEHMIVARALSRRQAKVFVGGIVRASGEPRAWQLYYYAVRDPSAVRVVPVEGVRSADGFSAAELRFRFPPASDEAVASPGAPRRRPDATPAAFLLTIGLCSGEDRAFFGRTVGDDDHEWSNLFALLMDRACSDAA